MAAVDDDIGLVLTEAAIGSLSAADAVGGESEGSLVISAGFPCELSALLTALQYSCNKPIAFVESSLLHSDDV